MFFTSGAFFAADMPTEANAPSKENSKKHFHLNKFKYLDFSKVRCSCARNCLNQICNC